MQVAPSGGQISHQFKWWHNGPSNWVFNFSFLKWIQIQFSSIKVCIPPEEEAIASKACGNKYKYCKKIVYRCPKQQKTTQIDQYLVSVYPRPWTVGETSNFKSWSCRPSTWITSCHFQAHTLDSTAHTGNTHMEMMRMSVMIRLTMTLSTIRHFEDFSISAFETIG